MIQPKTPAEIKILREGGKRHAQILAELTDLCVPGASSFTIENYTRKLCKQLDVVPAFLGYSPDGASYPFPAALCFSVNDEIVHGIPNQTEKILVDGDVLTLDVGIIYNGLVTDAATTIVIGQGNTEHQTMIDVAWQSLDAGIAEAVIDAPVSCIGRAIEQTVKQSGNYTIYRGLVGHGVGYGVHEDPNIPNFDTRERYPTLPEGAVLAIEPMIGNGSKKFILDQEDDWTYRTADGSISVQVEHTVAVTADGPQVLTTL